MLKIRELSDVLDYATTINYDYEVYYDTKNHKIYIEYVGDNCFDEDFEFREINPDFLEVTVDPFGRDLFISFFNTIENPVIRQVMFDQFHGQKKYRKVKSLFPRYHLLEKFYKFSDDYQLRIAKEWCENNKINYIDQSGKSVIFNE